MAVGSIPTKRIYQNAFCASVRCPLEVDLAYVIPLSGGPEFLHIDAKIPTRLVTKLNSIREYKQQNFYLRWILGCSGKIVPMVSQSQRYKTGILKNRRNFRL